MIPRACLLLVTLSLVACTSPGSRTSAPEPAAPAPAPVAAADASWAYTGGWTDACCCKVSCPCLFGTGPTEGFCEGASLFEAESGHYDGVRIDGLSAVVAYRVKGFTRIVVEEGATPEQVAAFGEVITRLLRFVSKGSPPTVTSGELQVAREGDTIRYGTQDTRVEITLVESVTGEPIVLQNLPAKGTPFPESHGHTQYVSTLMTHSSEDGSFEWSGRNGFASTIDLESPDA